MTERLRPGIVRLGGLVAVLVGLLAGTGAVAQPDVPALTGRVVDRADLLGADTEAVLVAKLQAHEDSTSNQIAVLTVPSLNGENLEEWATEVFRTWGLGQADRDNGVLLLIARDDRKIRIEVGFGLEGALPDATAGAIIRDEMTPRFRDGDFEGGTLAAVEAIVGSIQGEYVAAEASGEMPGWAAFLFMLFMTVIPAMVSVGNFTAGIIQRYAIAIFAIPFVAMMLAIGLNDLASVDLGPVLVGLVVGLFLLYVLADIVLSQTQWMREKRRHHKKKAEAFKRARKKGRSSVVVDGVTYSVPTASSSGGGGFSGGGGSSGGGGASGGW